MNSLLSSHAYSLHIQPQQVTPRFPCLNKFSLIPSSSFWSSNAPKFKAFTILQSSSPSFSTNPEVETEIETQEEEKFDWYAQWYPIMPVCDLNKKEPHAKRVIGIDVAVWWDRNDNSWKVFDDICPHRLAPLSEGRIDQWGRLQCVYHGWCFNGSGDCKFIPQASTDGPQVHTSRKAFVAVYPSTVQNGIIWFWPNSDPQFKDILSRKKPPYIPELDDPSYSKIMGNRDMPFGYEILTENLLDPAHVPYAHYGLQRIPQPKIKADREGGMPIEMNVKSLDVNGFITDRERSTTIFMAPCVGYTFPNPTPYQTNVTSQGNGLESSAREKQDQSRDVTTSRRRSPLVFICIPVSPGKSRVIWSFPRNFGLWKNKIVPRWMFHVGQLLVLDSDLYLLHLEERKIMDIGPSNWLKACYLPTKSDTNVIAFRNWLRRYSDGQIDWRGKFNGALPPTPPKEQLMDRYWSHVVNCSSCRAAHRGLNALQVLLQIISIASLGIVVAIKEGILSAATRIALVSVAVLFFAASRWLSHFVHKNFYFRDYNHAFRWN